MNSRAWAEAPAAVTRVDPAAPAAGRMNHSKELRGGGQVAQLIQSTNNFSGPSAAAYKRWKMTGQLPEEVVQERTFGRTTAASNRAADSFRALDEAAPQPAQLSRQPLRENPVTWTYGEGASAFTERPAPPPAPAPAPTAAPTRPLAAPAFVPLAAPAAPLTRATRPDAEDSPPQPPPSDVDWSEAMRRGLVPATAAHCMITMPPEFEPRPPRVPAAMNTVGLSFPKFGEDISRPNNGRSQKFTRGFGDANDRFF